MQPDSINFPNEISNFEKDIMRAPNSAISWMKYVAFYVERSDIEEARNIAERGLKSIGYREEEERFNLWAAYLNFEYEYGSEERFQELLKVFLINLFGFKSI